MAKQEVGRSESSAATSFRVIRDAEVSNVNACVINLSSNNPIVAAVGVRAASRRPTSRRAKRRPATGTICRYLKPLA